MKRAYLFSFLLLSCLLITSEGLAAVVSPEAAQQTAASFFKQQKNAVSARYSAPSKSVRLAATRMKTTTEEPAYYVYESDEAGFVLIAGDDRLRPVLGHAYKGTYDEQEMPENMRAWLNHLTAQISHLPADAPATKQLKANYTVVNPLLEIDGIEWNQGEPYNKYCPSISGETCPTGCVATAAAQIMRYWEWPKQGKGEHEYEWEAGERTLSADFSTHTYNWINILNKYISDNYTTTQANAVARLMSDVGIACNMQYNKGGSSANEYDAGWGLFSFFDYDSAMTVIRMDEYGVERFEQEVAKELAQGRPILMGGSSESGSGHAFVCDGVNKDALFHINWGWGGWYNGDFALTSMYPEGQGIGGAPKGEGYTEGVSALIGIQPNKGNPVKRYLTTAKMCVETQDGEQNVKRVARNEKILVKADTLRNDGLVEWNGYISYQIYDADMNYVDDYFVYNYETLALPTMTFYISLGFGYFAIDASLPNGDYHMVTAYTETPESTKWKLVTKPNGEYAGLNFTVTDDAIFFSSGSPSEPIDTATYLTDLSAEVMGEQVVFMWDTPTPADKYVLNIYDVDEEGEFIIRSDTITNTYKTVRFYCSGTIEYHWCVIALNDEGKQLERKNGENVEVRVSTDYSPNELSYTVRKDGILFSWEGKAPVYQIEISLDGEVVYRQFPVEKEHFFPYLIDGRYEWSIRSLNPQGTLFISDPVQGPAFSLPEERGIDEVVESKPDGKFLHDGRLFIRRNGVTYDILGR